MRGRVEKFFDRRVKSVVEGVQCNAGFSFGGICLVSLNDS